MKTLNLATLPLEERHTAANIMIWMEEVIEKSDDNGSNMVAAARLLEEKQSAVLGTPSNLSSTVPSKSPASTKLLVLQEA